MSQSTPQPVSCRFPKAPWYNTYTDRDGPVLTYHVPYASGTVQERFVYVTDDPPIHYFVKLNDHGGSDHHEAPWYTHRTRLCDINDVPCLSSVQSLLEKQDPCACLWKLKQGYPCVDGDAMTLIREAVRESTLISQKKAPFTLLSTHL